jgi:hypothetical protein
MKEWKGVVSQFERSRKEATEALGIKKSPNR